MARRNVTALAPNSGVGDLPTAGGSAAQIKADYKSQATVSNEAVASGSTASADAKATLRGAAMFIIAAVVLLWLLGGIVFRDALI